MAYRQPHAPLASIRGRNQYTRSTHCAHIHALIMSWVPGASFAPCFQSSFSSPCFRCNGRLFFPFADFFGSSSSSLEAASSWSDSELGSAVSSKSEAAETSSSSESCDNFAAVPSSSSESGSAYDCLAVAFALLDCLVGVSCAGLLDELREAVAGADFVDFRGMMSVKFYVCELLVWRSRGRVCCL